MAYMKTNAGSMTKENVDQKIRKKAQEIWEKTGCKTGHDLENWLQAERIVKAQMKRSA